MPGADGPSGVVGRPAAPSHLGGPRHRGQRRVQPPVGGVGPAKSQPGPGLLCLAGLVRGVPAGLVPHRGPA
eukprot:11222631-Lingulodinium_polyedra.AAC.1